MGNKNVRMHFEALDEVTSDEYGNYLTKDFKPNLIKALDEIEDQIMMNADLADNLIITNCTTCLILLMYLASLGFMLQSLMKAKKDIKQMKITKQQVSSSNMNYLNLGKDIANPSKINQMRLQREKDNDVEKGIANNGF